MGGPYVVVSVSRIMASLQPAPGCGCHAYLMVVAAEALAGSKTVSKVVNSIATNASVTAFVTILCLMAYCICLPANDD